MPAPEALAKKKAYAEKLIKYFSEYSSVLIVGVDNVGSAHMQSIRKNLRTKAEVLLGKNTMIRRAIKTNGDKHPQLRALLPHIKGNIGFVFTKTELNDIRKEISQNRLQAVAKAGAIAPQRVIIPAGPTGLDPQQTSFMQALNIMTKINKGQIEIINDVELLKEGDRVGQSEAALLAKLNIKPFTYGLTVLTVFDGGFVYDPSVLDLTDDDLLGKLRAGIANVAAISIAINFPTAPAVPYYFAKAFSNLVTISLATDITFKQTEKLKQLLENPEALAAATAAAAAASAAAAPAASKEPAKEAAKEAPKEKEEEPEVDDDIGDLFGGDF